MFFESICLVLRMFQANKLMCVVPPAPNYTICILQAKHNLLGFPINPLLRTASSCSVHQLRTCKSEWRSRVERD